MKHLVHSQRGVTLVEILAAIVIVGFLTVIIWRFFFQTIDYNSYAVTEQTLQQEANLILATLQAEHTRNTINKLAIESNAVVIYTGETNARREITKRPGITYQLFQNAPTIVNHAATTSPENQVTSNVVGNNRKNMKVYLLLTSEYKEGRPSHYLLQTTLSKLTTD